MKITDVTLEQIKNAAQLYIKGDFASSITLSGAAEEILGKISNKKTGDNKYNQEIRYIKGMHKSFGESIPDRKEINNLINKTKNKLKHNDSGEDYEIKDDLENEAVLLFIKAVDNYYAIYKKWPKSKIVTNLYEDLSL